MTKGKRYELERLIQEADVFVHLDPRRDGVIAPVWLKKEPRLVLQIGLNMAVPIRDLEIDDEGFRCTLSFNRSPFFCDVPWDSVFVMATESLDENTKSEQVVWTESVPPDLPKPKLEAVRKGPPKTRAGARQQTVSKPSPNGPRRLRPVPGTATKSRPSHLQLVKK